MASVFFPYMYGRKNWEGRNGIRNKFLIFNSSGSVCETESQTPESTHTLLQGTFRTRARGSELDPKANLEIYHAKFVQS